MVIKINLLRNPSSRYGQASARRKQRVDEKQISSGKCHLGVEQACGQRYVSPNIAIRHHRGRQRLQFHDCH